MSLPNSLKNNTVLSFVKKQAKVHLEEAAEFYWSPKEEIIYYDKSRLGEESGQWTLLHEMSHAKLNHQEYKSDLELLLYEVTAWEEAVKVGAELEIEVSDDYVQSCLDTYRDWLHARSKCPTCQLNGLQKSPRQYQCLNCLSRWQVSASRFCRPYRMTQNK